MKLLKMTVTTEWVDEETGEITKDIRELKEDSIKKPRATSTKSSSKIDNNPEPILTLYDNKYVLSKGAVDSLKVEPGDTIDIKFQKVDKSMIPVIGTSDSFGTKAGNKLTKSNTVSYRGKSNDELRVFGEIFTLEKHPSAEGLFILKGENTPEVKFKETPKPEEEDTEDTIIDEEADTLLEGEDAEEISDDDFTL
jgi:hypothetical protein